MGVRQGNSMVLYDEPITETKSVLKPARENAPPIIPKLNELQSVYQGEDSDVDAGEYRLNTETSSLFKTKSKSSIFAQPKSVSNSTKKIRIDVTNSHLKRPIRATRRFEESDM